jgi:hypothetical protein
VNWTFRFGLLWILADPGQRIVHRLLLSLDLGRFSKMTIEGDALGSALGNAQIRENLEKASQHFSWSATLAVGER